MTVQYRCVLLTEGADSERTEKIYDQFLITSSKFGGFFYYTSTYRSILKDVLADSPIYLLVLDGEEPVAVMPGFLRKTSAGLLYNSLPFFGPNAGLLLKNEDNSEAIIQCAFLFLRDYLSSIGALAAVVYEPLGQPYRELYRRYMAPEWEVERATLVTTLSPFPKWPPKVAWDIAKGESQGITFVSETDGGAVAEFYRGYESEARGRGIPVKPESFYSSIISHGLLENGSADLLLARDGEKIVGGVLSLVQGCNSSYHTPMILHDYRDKQILSALINRQMTRLASRGVTYWNWESSPSRESGVYKYKKKWLAEELPYSVFVVPFVSRSKLKALNTPEFRSELNYYFFLPFDEWDKL